MDVKEDGQEILFLFYWKVVFQQKVPVLICYRTTEHITMIIVYIKIRNVLDFQ